MIIHSVLQTIKREKLIEKNDKILIALSGGPDSVCLLDVLVNLREEYELKLYAAHLNHRIRGIDAQKDSIYCQKLCEEKNVTFFVKSIDIPKLAKDIGKGVEEIARDVRYDMFFKIKNSLGLDKIAVAHNIDDQAETVLMKIMRGSGMQGLKGIDYKRKDGIIRPLLDVYKKDINKYCEENELRPRIDKTNFEDEYTRNKIRLDLLPYIEEKYCPNIKRILSRTANIIRDDYNYIEDVAKESYTLAKNSQSKYEIVIKSALLKNMDIAIQKRVLRLAIFDLLGNLNNIENVHISDVLSLLDKPDGKNINLPRGIRAYTKTDELVITSKEDESIDISYSYRLELEGVTHIPQLSLTITSSVLDKQESVMLPTSRFIKVFDYAKVKGDIFVRSRENGDKIQPIGMNGTKKIKDILIDKKIPLDQRYMYPILSDGEDILWIACYRISEKYKVDRNTKKVIRMQFEYDEERRQIVEKFI